ncbi:IS3 family transposase [Enterococcus faecalis]
MFYEHKVQYGSSRITQQFYNEGIETNKRVVAVLMREMNLYT